MSSQQLDEERIFHTARGIPDVAVRSDYLDQICAGDAGLRERVESLLAVHDNEQSFLKSDPDAAPTVDHTPITEHPGTTIGRYKLMEQIGEDGMGTVFVAEQERPIRRKVALKVIKPGMDSKAVVARFEAERQALALMDHPNIAKVLDAGTTDSGRPYFVMELVRGIPITEYCDEHKLTIRERLELFTQVCQAIQHAHQKAIIHRDIKPTNVLVTEQDGKPVPKVIDFGVAKALNQRLTERTIYTSFAQVVGTPLYMSPEQAALSAVDVDTRSDVYSLGVLLYELLTGTTPFDRQRFEQAAYDEIRRIVREEEPPKPSTRISGLGLTADTVAEHRKTDLHGLQKAVRGDLDWILMKALEKDRGRRYETPNSLARDVSNYVENEPIDARPPTFQYRVAKYLKRNRVPVAVAGLLIATLSLGLLGTAWQAGVAMKRAEEAETALDKYRDELFQRALLAGMSNDPDFEDLINRAEDVALPPFKVTLLRGQERLYSGQSEEAATLLEKAVKLNPESVAAQAALAVANLHRGRFGDWLESSFAVSQLKPSTPEDFLLKAQAIMAVSDPEGALDLANTALEMRHSPLAIAMRAEVLAWVAINRDDFGVLIPAIEDIKALRRTLPNDSAFVLNVDLFIHLVAMILSDPSRYDELAEEARYASDRIVERFPHYELGRYHRANYLDLVGENDASEKEWRELVAIRPRAEWVIDYAMMLYRNERFHEAREQVLSLGTSSQSIFGTLVLCDSVEDLPAIRQRLEDTTTDAALEEFKLRSLTLIGDRQRASELAESWITASPTRTGVWPSWDRSKLRFYADRDFTDADLLKAAGRSRFMRCDAFCLLGVFALADGDFSKAKLLFQKATDTRAVWFESYQMADAMLRRLESSDWPDWVEPTSVPGEPEAIPDEQ